MLNCIVWNGTVFDIETVIKLNWIVWIRTVWLNLIAWNRTVSKQIITVKEFQVLLFDSA